LSDAAGIFFIAYCPHLMASGILIANGPTAYSLLTAPICFRWHHFFLAYCPYLMASASCSCWLLLSDVSASVLVMVFLLADAYDIFFANCPFVCCLSAS
jgi:hypothetical protein